MKRFPFPLKVHSGLSIKITQPFGDLSNLEWYKSKGINFPFHNGVDAILSGTPMQTYGSELITPEAGWRIVKTTFDSPMSTKGNGVTIESPRFDEDGITKILQVVYWHCSEVQFGTQYRNALETVAYVGNSGAVRPAPTPECPYDGSHLHLMLFEFHVVNGIVVLQNADNGVNGAIDPLTRFDTSWTIAGTDPGSIRDTAPADWAFQQRGLTENWQKIIFAIKNWLKF